MIEKLQIIQQRFDEVSDLIIQPNIISDQKRYIKLNKEYKDLSIMVEKIKVYNTLLSNLNEAELLIKNEVDSEMISMAKMEVESLKDQLPELEEEIKLLLIPKDPEDAKNVVIEIRAGTGGDEASIFAGDLYR
ncbi:MAG: peptide chain release factor 1, partial [Flavobacteriaceae bacterium TMED208]